MDRFNLSYLTPKNGRITLHGLAQCAVREIKRVQSDLGSTDFEVSPYTYPDPYCPSCRANHSPLECARKGAAWRY